MFDGTDIDILSVIFSPDGNVFGVSVFIVMLRAGADPFLPGSVVLVGM